jgi:glycerate-2-kinase
VVTEVLQDQPRRSEVVNTEADVFDIVGDNATFVEAVAAAARRDGYTPSIVHAAAEGEARFLADRFLDFLTNQPDDVDVVLGGGEATVTVKGNGVGGRNSEFALATAIRLAP